MCLSYHMCFQLISGFSYAHGHLAFMVWLQRGYRVCVWYLAVRELAMWSVSGCMTGIQILKGTFSFRLHRFENDCRLCAISCPVLSGDCTTVFCETVVSIYQAIRRHVPEGVLTPSWRPHASHYPGFLWFSSDLQENCRLIAYRQYGHNRFLSGTFFAWFQVSATRYEMFVLLICYAACNCS